MSYTVAVLPDAEQDLRSIYHYIQQHFGAAVARQKYAAIRDAILLLEKNAKLGTAIPQLTRLGMTHYHHLIVETHNRVVYEIIEPSKEIVIHIICNTQQDYDSVLHNRILRR